MTRIQTERLLLTPYAPGDLEPLHGLWTSPGVRRYLFDNEIIPPDFVREEIAANASAFERGGWGQWAARLKGRSEIAGFCGFRPFHDPPELELLFGVTEAHWGQGLAGEMSRALMALAFEHWGFTRVQASTDAPNLASIRVMEKLGMTLLRREISGGLDTVYYEMRAGDFDASGVHYELLPAGT